IDTRTTAGQLLKPYGSDIVAKCQHQSNHRRKVRLRAVLVKLHEPRSSISTIGVVHEFLVQCEFTLFNLVKDAHQNRNFYLVCSVEKAVNLYIYRFTVPFLPYIVADFTFEVSNDFTDF